MAATIGQLARQTGVKATTIRFYESIGLMPEPPRTESDRRLYGAEHLSRLSFIKHGRDLGFDLNALRALLELAGSPQMPCDDADRLARDHLAAVEEKIARLKALRTELRRMIDACERGGVETCRIIDTLADHGNCASQAH